MANRVTMTICGQDYTLVADESAAYMQKVGALVDQKMTELMDSAHVSRYDAAVLAAINLADELCMECNREFYDDSLQAFLGELDGRLDYRTWFFGHYHDDEWRDDKHRLIYQDIVRIEARCADGFGETTSNYSEQER